MWMEERKTGYVFIEKYKDPLTGKWKSVSVTSRSKTKAACNAADRALRDRIAKIYHEAGQVANCTVREAVDAYIADKALTCKRQTVIGYRAAFNVISERLGPQTRLDKLTAPYVRRQLMDSPGTYNERLKKFKTFIKWCGRNNYLSDISWLDNLERMNAPTPRARNAQKYLDHGEIEAVLDGMENERYKLMTELLILSGLRIGEAVALEVADITDVISVTKTYSVRIHDISTTKTATSAREVFIQDELAALIKRIKRWRLEDMMANGYKSPLLIPSRTGGYMSSAWYNNVFKEVTEKAIGRRLTVHSLRHTHVAMLAEAGLSLEEIAMRCGHSDSQITREVYYHVTEKMKEKSRERIKNVRII